MLGKPEITQEHLKEKNLTRRKNVRERITTELRECMEGSYFENKKRPLDQTSIFSLLSFVKLDSFLQNYLPYESNEWDKCKKTELENVSHYYHLLYTENLPHNITEMLLGQKSKIEECLVEYS